MREKGKRKFTDLFVRIAIGEFQGVISAHTPGKLAAVSEYLA
jgi:hypothetical protein